MPGQITPITRWYVTNNGAAVPGAKLYTYISGTDTPLAVYSDAALQTPRTNPVEADAGGLLPVIYLKPQNYRFLVTDANGVTIYTTQDNVPGTASLSGYFLSSYSSLADAVTAIGATVATLIIDVNGTVSASVTLPDTLTVMCLAPCTLTVASGQTLTINGPILAPEAQLFAGSGSVILPNAGDIYVRWFGGKGDDSTDNSTAIQKTIACAQASRNANVVFGAGIYRYGTQITVSNVSNGGVSFIGVRDEAFQQGSAYPATLLRWTGGASPTFLVSETYTQFLNFAIENVGTATHFVKVDSDGAGRVRFERVCGTMASGAVQYSTAVIETAHTNYDRYFDCEFTACAPIILLINEATATGTTTVTIRDCLIESVESVGDLIFVKLVGHGAEILTIEDCTFNAQDNVELTVVDTDSIGPGNELTVLNFRNNEYDAAQSAVAAARMLKLTRCRNAIIAGNSLQGGSAMTAMIALTESYAHLTGNYGIQIDGPLVECLDSDSKIFGNNNYVETNTEGILASGSSSGIAAVTIVTTNVLLLGQHGNPGGETVYLYTASDSTARQVSFVTPSDSTWGYMTRGQLVTLMVKNTSGGAMGDVTFAASIKTAGALTKPANGKNISIGFVFDGTNLVELWRGAADVDN